MSTEASTGSGDVSTGAPASTGGGGSTGDAFSWGDGWRSHIAAGTTDSEKELKRLERFEGPDQIYRSWREMENLKATGQLRSVLPEKATEEEITQWRKDNAIPAKPEDYKITMPEGRDKPPEDDAFLKGFLKSAHEQNYTQEQVDGAFNSFYAEVDRQQEAVTESEKKLEAATEDQLRKDWGEDYRTNKAMAEALLARAPEGFRDKFMNGYLEDQTPIKASAESWKWLVQMEREINPAATVVPGQTGDLGKAVAVEIVELKKLMSDTNSKYWKGPEADKLQSRYRQLIAAQENMKAKAG